MYADNNTDSYTLVLSAAESGGEGAAPGASGDCGQTESPHRGRHPGLTRGPAGHPPQALHTLTYNPSVCNSNPRLSLF